MNRCKFSKKNEVTTAAERNVAANQTTLCLHTCKMPPHMGGEGAVCPQSVVTLMALKYCK